jgi:hypothetical protein
VFSHGARRADRRGRSADQSAPPVAWRGPRRGRGLLLTPLLTVGLLVLTAGTAGATGPRDTEGGGDSIAITATGLSYSLSTDDVSSGLVKTTLWNRGDQPHQAQIAKFKPGVGVADFRAILQGGNPEAVIGLFAGFYGGPNVVAPGHSQTTWENLPPGRYLLLCFVPDAATGMPHFAMGMYAPFEVAGPPGSGGVDADQTVTAVDPFQFVIPAEMHTDSVVRFQNQSAMDVHELSLGRLHPGKTVADVVAWADPRTGGGPPPFDVMGGAGALNPGGGQEWFSLHLPPGSYIAFCLVPDDETGLPHAAMGMVQAFTVVG